MRDQAEYQQLLQRWIEGEEISREEQTLLEQLLASDPDFARSHQQLLRVEESVQMSRHILLSEGDSVRLRSTVEALSRSVPSVAASGGGVIAKIVGSTFLLFVVVTGVFLFVNRGGTDSPQPSISTGDAIHEQVSPEENRTEVPSIESPAISSEGQVAEPTQLVKERSRRDADTKGSRREMSSGEKTPETNVKSHEKGGEGVNPAKTPQQNRGDINGSGFFDTSKLGRTN